MASDDEICTHFGEDASLYHGSVSPPIFQTSLFAFQDFKTFAESQKLERENFVYTRGVNPTVEILEKKLAQLERGEKCKCFGSGMGAISATFQSILKSGDHVLFINSIYGPTTQLLNHLKRFNVSHDFVSNDLNNVETAIRPNTRMIYVESPGTMLMNVVDLQAVANLAKQHNIVTAIDNTWSTPLFQKPLTLGFDLSIHSLTKYIGGHSDVTGGAVIGDYKLIDHIFEYGFQLNGSTLAPFDAFLVTRGLRTLPIRMKQHQTNAVQVIEYLKQKEEIKAIYHPSMETGFMARVVDKQMEGLSGLFSFELKDSSYESVAKFIDGLSLFKIGVSWGGFESQVNSPAKDDNEEDLRKQGLSPGLIRLSIGLEGAEAQINDLEQGFLALHMR